MAGNKGKRISAGTMTASRKLGLPIVSTRVIRPTTELLKLHDLAATSMNSIIRQDGTILSWMNVHYRLTTGRILVQDNYVWSEEVATAFEHAFRALTLINMRLHDTGVLGAMIFEADAVAAILDVIKQASLEMGAKAMLKAARDSEKYYEDLMAANQKASDKYYETLGAVEIERAVCAPAT
jgi:hypothetical protein